MGQPHLPAHLASVGACGSPALSEVQEQPEWPVGPRLGGDRHQVSPRLVSHLCGRATVNEELHDGLATRLDSKGQSAATAGVSLLQGLARVQQQHDGGHGARARCVHQRRPALIVLSSHRRAAR